MKKLSILSIVMLLAVQQVFTQSYKVITGPGPEDLVLDNSQQSPRILISCAERRMMQEDGWIFSLNPETDLAVPMLIDMSNLPESYYLHPHGMDIMYTNSGTFLYVINHLKAISDLGKRIEPQRHVVIKFQVLGDTLKALEAFENKLITAPNDIVVLPDGGFIVSNCMRSHTKHDRNRAMIWAKKDGSLVHYNPNSNAYSVIDHKLAFPNGMLINDRYLYLSCTMENAIYRYDYSYSKEAVVIGNKTSIAKVKAPDNLSISENLLLYTSTPKPIRFVKHAKATKNFCGSESFSMDLKGTQAKLVFKTDGADISTVSGYIEYNGYYYFSQVFEPWILKVKK